MAGVLNIPAEKVRVLSYDIGGNFGSRNRPYVEYGLVVWAAGKIKRPVKYTATRSEAFLTDYQGRDLLTNVELAFDKARKNPGDARRQHQQRRRALRFAVAAVEGLGPDHRQLRHSGGGVARARGVHQHHADQRLSLVRPARGDLRHRADDGHGGRPARHRSHQAAPQESGEAEEDAVPQRGRHDLRQRHLRGEHGPRHEDRRLATASSSASAKPRSAASCWASASPTTSSPRSARRRSAPRSP